MSFEETPLDVPTRSVQSSSRETEVSTARCPLSVSRLRGGEISAALSRLVSLDLADPTRRDIFNNRELHRVRRGILRWLENDR